MHKITLILLFFFLFASAEGIYAEETISSRELHSQLPAPSAIQFFEKNIDGFWFVNYNKWDLNSPATGYIPWQSKWVAGIMVDMPVANYQQFDFGLTAEIDTRLIANLNSRVPHCPERVCWYIGSYLSWQKWTFSFTHACDHLVTNGVGKWDVVQKNTFELKYQFRK